MMKEFKNIDDLFKKSMAELEAEPPAGEWQRIAVDLDKLDKKRTLVWLYRLAAMLAFVLLVASAYFYFNSNSDKEISKQTKATDEKKIIKPENSFIAKNNSKNLHEKPVKHQKSPIHYKAGKNPSEQSKVIVLKKQVNSNEEIAQNQQNNLLNIEQDKLTPMQQLPVRLIDVKPINEDIIYSDEYIRNALASLFIDKPEPEKNNTLAWNVGGQFAPVYSYRDLRTASGSNNYLQNPLNAEKTYLSNPAQYKKQENQKDGSSVLYAGGLSFNLNSSKRISFQSGIYYSQLGYTAKNISAVTLSDEKTAISHLNTSTIITSAGVLHTRFEDKAYVDTYPNGNISADAESGRVKNSYYSNAIGNPDVRNDVINNNGLKQRYEYIEIPFIFKYSIIQSKTIVFQLLGGASADVYLNNMSYFKTDKGRQIVGEYTDTKKLNYSGLMGIGMEYPLFSNLTLSLQPAFKYYFNSIYKNGTISTNLYSFSVFTGLNYNF